MRIPVIVTAALTTQEAAMQALAQQAQELGMGDGR